MSDVEEAPAVKKGFESGHVCVGDLLGNPHRKRVSGAQDCLSLAYVS